MLKHFDGHSFEVYCNNAYREKIILVSLRCQWVGKILTDLGLQNSKYASAVPITYTILHSRHAYSFGLNFIG